MKNSFPLYLWLVTIVAGFVYAIYPLIGTSWYLPAVRILSCKPQDCMHEVGHKMDHDLGFPSRTPEFMNAVQQYLLVEMQLEAPSELARTLMGLAFVYSERHPYSSYELYAAIYDDADGDIAQVPLIFQPFFSIDSSYGTLTQCLAGDGFNVCNTSFSFVGAPGKPSFTPWLLGR